MEESNQYPIGVVILFLLTLLITIVLDLFEKKTSQNSIVRSFFKQNM